MRQVPEALQLHLDRSVTTLARCWRLTRGDGTVLGFTDHDERLTFDGTTFEAATGFTSGEAEAELGLGAGTEGVEGALSAEAISEADLAAGRFDGARVEIFLVNWQSPGDHLLLDVAELGEVKRGADAFAAELRGIAGQLNRQRGRYYRRRCDAVLGDARCRVDVNAPQFVLEATVVREVGGAFDVTGLVGASPALFARGRVEMLDGEAAGLRAEIASLGEGIGANETRVALLRTLAATVRQGNGMRVRAGCDKSFATCRAVFSNGQNFRGFPHLPGTDAALGVAKRDGLHDGGPVVP